MRTALAPCFPSSHVIANPASAQFAHHPNDIAILAQLFRISAVLLLGCVARPSPLRVFRPMACASPQSSAPSISAGELQRQSDAQVWGSHWRWANAAGDSDVPRLVHCPSHAGTLGRVAGHVWLANVDCVLDARWLLTVEAIIIGRLEFLMSYTSRALHSFSCLSYVYSNTPSTGKRALGYKSV